MCAQARRKTAASKDVRSVPRVRVVVEASAKVGEGDYLDCPASINDLPLVREDVVSSDRERFACFHLDAKGRLVSWEVVSVGSLMAAIVHPREIFKAAILANAASVVLCHNHPSGDPTPSPADLQLTRRLAKAGDLLGIEVLDHVVVTATDFVSMRDRGIL